MIDVPGAARVLRYTVPVDDRWHTHMLSGPIVHVDARTPETVEFWALEAADPIETVREFRVFGTGHSLPGGRLAHHGTVLVAGGGLVWHLIERTDVSGMVS